MLIKKLPWKALLIFALGLTIGLYFGNKGTLKTVEKTLNTKTISEAVNKPTQQNTVNNKVEIGKVKKSDSLFVSFNPTTDQKPINIITSQPCDSIWQKLTDNKKRRLERWLKGG